MDKENQTKVEQVQPTKIEKVVHFYDEIPLPQGSTTVPYKPQHTATTRKSKKSKKKFQEFSYYRLGEDNNKIMKILFKDQSKYMITGYYPFTDPLDQIENAENLSTKNLRKVIKTEAAYIGHMGDQLVIKKMAQVKLGGDGTEFDTIGDNFQIIKISNQQRFDQFMRILKTHPKALQISIRVIIDESVVGSPVVIDYQFFKREQQLKTTNQKFIDAK